MRALLERLRCRDYEEAEFFAAVLTNQGGFYGAGAYVQEGRRWGIRTLPSCVNESDVEYLGKTVSREPAPGPLPIGQGKERGWVRPGLRFVGGNIDKRSQPGHR